MEDNVNNGSRSEIRGRRRKTNLILNMLIGIVLLLIVIVSCVIFLGGNDNETADTAVKETESSKQKGDDTKTANNETAVNEEDEIPLNEKGTESSEEPEKPEDGDAELKPADESKAVVTEGGSNANVKKTVENPTWTPVGTAQTGEHTTQFDKSSVDWQEMLKAISYASGLDKENMIVWFIGNNGPNKAVGTVSSKDKQEKYRVYINWIEGQGWKPVKLEELKEIDRGR